MQPQNFEQSDEQLLQLIAEGNEESFLFLYDRYKTILFNIILRLIRNRAEAEDILQEAFLQVWQNASNFDEIRGRGFTWLVTIARRRTIDKIRNLSSQQRIAFESARGKSNSFFSLEDESSYKQQQHFVKKAVRNLPAEQREILNLAYYQDLSQSEIADKLATPLGTIKTRSRNAMKRLRNNFRLKAFL